MKMQDSRSDRKRLAGFLSGIRLTNDRTLMRIREGNEKFRRVQEKCGFTYHHTDKDIHWKVMDDIRTEHITRLTKEEWKNRFEIRSLSEDGDEIELAMTVS
jgi:hypothetical protein